jgi:archaellum component FlaD/FlaE
MKRFIIAAAAAALLGVTALSTAQAQDTQAGQEEIIKKPNTNSATEAAPGQQQKSGETESATEVAPGQQQQTGEADAKDAAPGQVKKQDQATGEQQQKAPGKADSDSASDNKQPSTETTGSININTEQKTEITQVFREVKAEPVSIDIEVNVGVTVPKTTRLRPLPPRVIEIVPAYRGYEYFVLADGRIIIVEPGTLEVVYILVG